MIVAVDPELESALNAHAQRQGVAPEDAALEALRQRFLGAAPPVVPRDEWERVVLGVATDCGVSLPHSALSSDGIYE
jgi:hypothetical protein